MALFSRKWKKQEAQPKVLWLYTTLSLVCFSWFGSTSSPVSIYKKALFPSEYIADSAFWVPTIMLAIFAFSSWRIFVIGKIIFPSVKEVSVERDPTTSQVLICNLSRTPVLPKIVDGKHVLVLSAENELVLTGNLEQDISNLSLLEEQKISWNWTQLLRGIQSHVNRLEKLYLITTADSVKNKKTYKGSYEFSAEAKKLFKLYFPDNSVEIKIYDKRVEPEAIVQSHQVYSELMDDLIDRQGYTDENIAIDITGGTSLMSIAGALSTLQNRVVFQYVTTDGRGDVIQFGLNLVAHKNK